jgi:hypothetical protein
MRSVLVWMVYGIIPESPWILRATLNTMVFGLWFAMITYLSVQWRDRLDGSCAVFTAWIEEVMLGRKNISDFEIVRDKLKMTQANGRHDMEKGKDAQV